MKNNISKIREKYRFSQIQLASEIKWSQPRLSNYERGERFGSIGECRLIVEGLNRLLERKGQNKKLTVDDVFPPQEKAA